MTEWKEIKGYEGRYLISNKGEVKSFSKVKGGSLMKLANGAKITRGYYKHVDLSLKGISINHRVHRLVAEHFILNPHNKRTVNHIDGNPSNNGVDNLEWATHTENMNHSFEKLKRTGPIKLPKSEYENILNRFNNGETKRNIAKTYNLSENLIGKVINDLLAGVDRWKEKS